MEACCFCSWVWLLSPSNDTLFIRLYVHLPCGSPDNGSSSRWSHISSQHLECSAFPCSIHSQKAKALIRTNKNIITIMHAELCFQHKFFCVSILCHGVLYAGVSVRVCRTERLPRGIREEQSSGTSTDDILLKKKCSGASSKTFFQRSLTKQHPTCQRATWEICLGVC